MTSTLMREPDSLSISALSVVLIAPHDARRRTLAKALAGSQANVVQEFGQYPNFGNIAKLIELNCDVVIMDLDTDSERALDLVENICSHNGLVTVMAYSSRNDPELLVRCMRAGARELLTDPVLPGTIGEAFVRASARRLEGRRQKKVAGKMLVFVGAKGGSGVTTLASNFAVALTKESGGNVVMIDMDLQLGDAALALGIQAKFSTLDALRHSDRLDPDFVSTLLTKHSSGLAVLAAPDEYNSFASLEGGAGKLLRLLRDEFPFVVVDAGSKLGNIHELLFDLADSIYLVTQVNIPALRNSHRLISHFSTPGGAQRIEVVLNRFDSRSIEIDETRITKALTQPAKWKIPNNYEAVRRAQNTGVALALEDTPVSRVLFEMARAACGKPSNPGKKRKLGFFGGKRGSES